MSLTNALISFIVSLVIALVGISLTLKNLFSSISQSEKAQAKNYAGRTVSYGLSIVWVVWAIALGIFSLMGESYSTNFLLFPPLLTVALVLFSAFVGFIDDAYGDKGSQGFRGHLKAFARGEFTTGAMKLFFISGASFIFGWLHYPALLGTSAAVSVTNRFLYALVAGAAIALCCNFINLTDLRPGRASKVSMLVMALAVITFAISLLSTSLFTWSLEVAVLSVLVALISAVWLLAPILAVIGLDLKEKGMLGDAGANGMGILVGVALVVACKLNFLALGSLALAFLFLNVLSEKVSFSKLIEEIPLLRAFDGLGRFKDKE